MPGGICGPIVFQTSSIGVASPRAVTSLTERVGELGQPVGGHFHNTRNTGYSNALAALESGASIRGRLRSVASR